MTDTSKILRRLREGNGLPDHVDSMERAHRERFTPKTPGRVRALEEGRTTAKRLARMKQLIAQVDQRLEGVDEETAGRVRFYFQAASLYRFGTPKQAQAALRQMKDHWGRMTAKQRDFARQISYEEFRIKEPHLAEG